MTQGAKTWRNDLWVRPYFGRYRRALVASLALGIFTLVFAVALMFTSGYLISAAAMQPDRGLFELLIPIGFVQLFGVGKPLLGYCERLTSHDWVFRMTSDLRRRLYLSIEHDGMFWSATHKVGDALGLLAQDIGHVQNLYLRTVFPLIIAWTLGGIVVVTLGLFSIPFALMMLLGFLVMGALLPLAAVLVDGARQERAKQARSNLYESVYDNVAGVSDWVYAQRKDDYVARVVRSAECIDEIDAHIARNSRRREFVLQVVFVALAVGLFVWTTMSFGGESAVAARVGGATATGAWANWIAAFVLGFFPLLEAFEPLSDATVEAVSHTDSVERFNEMPDVAGVAQNSFASEGNQIADNQEDADSVGEIDPENTNIEVQNLSFAYDNMAVLDDINLTIPAGQKLAILGPSGAGKSTLVSLLRGDLEATEGDITLGGVPMRELNKCGKIHHYLGLMQQSTYLFHQTLKGNLKIGNPKVTDEEAEEALRKVGLGGLYDRLPKGLATMVDEAGLRFSGGERHRIALARLLLQEAPVIVLDEPTVGLDPVTEQVLLDTIFEVFHDRTVIMVTHHLQGVENMDRVLFVENGHIALDGIPKQLAKENKRYQQLLAFDQGQ